MAAHLSVVTSEESAINRDAWAEWREYRIAKRKPMSALAERKTLSLLATLSHEQQQEVIDTSIMNDWQGLFPQRLAMRSRPLADDLNDRSWAR